MSAPYDYPPQRPRRVRLAFAHGKGELFAGPYLSHRSLPRSTYRVKMASEVKAHSDVSVPCVDFGVPEERAFRQALQRAALRLARGRHVFVGCGYGIGRTGTFVAAVCKLNREVLWITRRARDLGEDALFDPVEEARDVYYRGAVETKEQADFVRLLDVKGIARRIAFIVKPSSVLDKRFWGR